MIDHNNPALMAAIDELLPVYLERAGRMSLAEMVRLAHVMAADTRALMAKPARVH